MSSRFYLLSRNLLQTMGAALVALVLVGCAAIEDSKPAKTPPSRTSTRRSSAASAVASWTGSYVGMLPCSDCEALKVELSLYKDATYKLQTQEVGSGKPANVRRGSFTFNADETRITLDDSGQGRRFDILSTGHLRMLGKDGRIVTDENARGFIFRKVN